MTKMSQKAADLLLEAVSDLEHFEFPPNSEFNMRDWGVHLGTDHTPEEKNYCGTSACAIGWLSTMPKWQDRGLKGRWKVCDGKYKLRPISSRYNDWMLRAESVFGVNYSSVEFLFAELTNQTLPEFSKKVRRFVEMRLAGNSVSTARRAICREFSDLYLEIE